VRYASTALHVSDPPVTVDNAAAPTRQCRIFCLRKIVD